MWFYLCLSLQVGESSLQSGNLYSPFMKTCRNFFLGSNQSDQGHSFKGYIGGVVLWDYERSHEDLLRHPLQINKTKPVLAMWANFSKVNTITVSVVQSLNKFLSYLVSYKNDLFNYYMTLHCIGNTVKVNSLFVDFTFNFEVEQLWSPSKDGFLPNIITIPVPEQEFISPFLPPPCGLTPCDNIDIISGYNNNWQLRAPKRIRYRIVNLSNDNGGNPTVTQSQIMLQHQALTEALRPYNITLDLSVYTVKNTSLRQQFILSNCRIGKIGNRHCDPECDHPRTGHDGGDCLRLGPCYNWQRQDGVCNMECNSIHFDYDDGDCCDPEVTNVLKTCFDPESPDR